MNSTATKTNPVQGDNIVPLPDHAIIRIKPRQRSSGTEDRFTLQEFDNPRTGSKSWRISGITREGDRIRQNFKNEQAARGRKIELETEYQKGHSESALRETPLTQEQLRAAEAAITQLGEDWTRLLDAVSFWKASGNKFSPGDSPRLDDAVAEYLVWLAAAPFRDATKRNWKYRMGVFKQSVENVRVADITPDFIDGYLATRKTTPSGKDTDRRAISRFFSWALERPRRWASANPCREVRVAKGESAPPSVLSVDQCMKLLRAAETHKGGMLVPYVAVCLFAGMRPFETRRLPWEQVNLKDKEIRLEAMQTKTGRKSGRGRTVAIDPTLAKWLGAYKGIEFFPANWRKEFAEVRKAAGITHWPDDVLRHTAISHHFRLHNSFGKAAEQFGNSEDIIKKHYLGRVTSDDTKKFYALKPGGKGKL